MPARNTSATAYAEYREDEYEPAEHDGGRQDALQPQARQAEPGEQQHEMSGSPRNTSTYPVASARSGRRPGRAACAQARAKARRRR